MAVAATFIILAASIVYFCLDRAEKIDRNGIGRVLIYLSVPLLLALSMCVNAMSIAEGIDIEILEKSLNLLEEEPDIKGAASYFITLIIQMLASVPALITSLAGCISAVRYELDQAKTAFGANSLYSARRMLKTSCFAAAFGLISAIAAAVFFCIMTGYAVGGISLGIIEILIVSIIMGALTFGIGFIIMIIGLPIWLLTLGITVVIVCVPYAVSACIWSFAFVVLHVFTVIFAAFAIKCFCAEGIIPKKRGIIFGLLSAMPIANLFVTAHLFSTLKTAGIKQP